MFRYAELLYNGLWFSPERRALQALIDETQQYNSGTVRLKLYKVQYSSSWIYVEPSLVSNFLMLHSAKQGIMSPWSDVLDEGFVGSFLVPRVSRTWTDVVCVNKFR